jgi:hypothetical protein
MTQINLINLTHPHPFGEGGEGETNMSSEEGTQIFQGEIPLELKFVDDRIFLNYWDSNGNDICCQIIDGKIKVYRYTPMEVELLEGGDVPDSYDPLEQTEITLIQFIERVKHEQGQLFI